MSLIVGQRSACVMEEAISTGVWEGKLTQFKFIDFIVSFFVAGTGILACIVAGYHSGWSISMLVSVVAVLAYFLMRMKLSNHPGFEYYVSVILSILASVVIFESKGTSNTFVLLYVLLPVIILLRDWKAFLPYIIIVLATYLFTTYILKNETLVQSFSSQIYMFIGFLLIATICSYLSVLLKSVVNQVNVLRDKLDQLIEYEKNNIEFAKQISSGNFDSQYNLKDNDILGQSLVEMSKNLKEAVVIEKQRNWSVEGIAKIADILRMSHQNMNELAYSVISHLVRYMKANQGGIFILNDEDADNICLELSGCYAYEKRKFVEKKIAIGQGLVGQAYLEKDMIYLTNVPENYVNITSGLGEATPNCLVIVPIKMEDQVIGVLELASFKEFQSYEREFLEKACENIASAIISSKVQDKTGKLLKESQEMAEEMRAQEEEMRQNMEELQATQESLQRESIEKENMQKEILKTKDFLQSIIDAIPDPVFVKDREGHRLIMVNQAWKDNYSGGRDVIGRNDFDLFPKELAEVFYNDEEKIFNDKTEFSAEEKGVKNGKEIFNITKKRVIENEYGEMFLVGINHDITELKKLQGELTNEKYLLDALMNTAEDLIYFKDIESRFIRISNNMLKGFKVNSQEEIKGKSDFDFFTEEHARQAYEDEQRIILTEKPLLSVIEKETWEDGRISYVSTSKMPLRDLDGKVVGTFGISRNVTESVLNGQLEGQNGQM